MEQNKMIEISKYLDCNDSDFLPKSKKGFSTKCIHSGQSPDKITGSLNVPIHLSSTFVQSEPTGQFGCYLYSRLGNPTRHALEECLADLEGGKYCVSFSSGMAAVTCVAYTLQPGDHMICSDDVYGGTNKYFRTMVHEKHSVDVDFIDLNDQELLEKTLKSNTKLVWIESPTNPLIKLVDIVKVVKQVRDKCGKECLIAVDNTFASPYLQQPLEFGVDIVMHSLTKFIAGHSDLIMGAVIVQNKDLYDKLYPLSYSFGGCPSAFDCYMAMRGLKTLKLRMKQHVKNAYRMARFLHDHPCVEKVNYPGLIDDPCHELAKKQMSGYGSILSFYIKGDVRTVKKFLLSLKMVQVAVSLGGVESLIEHPATMTHAPLTPEARLKLGITDNFIRFSVGIEECEDIMKDIHQALLISNDYTFEQYNI